MDPEEMETEAPKVEQATTAPEEPQRESLDEKFPLQTMEFGKIGKVVFRDVKPETLREGGDVPIVMMTGWAMNQEVIGNTTKGLYEAGQRVVPFDITGGGKGVEGMSQFTEINRQGDLLKKWIEGRSDEKFHLVGQSMSALVLLSMIENNPDIADKIASVVLVSPMGLGGKDSLPGLLKRQGDETKRNNSREKTDEDKQIESRVAKSFKEFLLHHPIRAAKEGFAMAGADEYDVLNLLQEKGIKTAIIQGDLDKLNSSERVWNKIGEGSESSWKTLTQEEYDKDARYREHGIGVGDKVWNSEVKNETPPFDSIKMVAGGHEIFGPEAIAKKILRTVDYLTQNGEEKKAEQKTLEELSETREALKEVAQTPPEQPQNPAE